MMRWRSWWNRVVLLAALAASVEAGTARRPAAQKDAQWARKQVEASWRKGRPMAGALWRQLGRVHVLGQQPERTRQLAVVYEVLREDRAHVVAATVDRKSGEVNWVGLEASRDLDRLDAAAERVREGDWRQLAPRGLSYSGQSELWEHLPTHQLVAVPLGPGHAQLVRRGKAPRAPQPVVRPQSHPEVF
jgi:hypothetical protein